MTLYYLIYTEADAGQDRARCHPEDVCEQGGPGTVSGGAGGV